jgi:pimeloyl-ACP methyl ester carboxylesterase
VAEQADDATALLGALDATPAIVIARSYGGSVAVDLALRYPSSVRALALLEGDALGLSDRALEWTRALAERLRAVASDRGIDAVYEALIDEVMGPGVWPQFPAEARAVLSANGPALLAELGYVDEPHPDAAAFATIDVPVLVVAARESPVAQREMTDAMAAALPRAQLAVVDGGHLIDPASPAVLTFVEAVARG